MSSVGEIHGAYPWPLRHLINNAGILIEKSAASVLDTKADMFRSTLETNFFGALRRRPCPTRWSSSTCRASAASRATSCWTKRPVFSTGCSHSLPGAVIVRDVFPYSAAGVGLTGTRVFSRFWQLLDRMRLRGDALLSSLINVRNIFQVAVAADPRYGPIFAYGVARVIAREATRAGFRADGDAAAGAAGLQRRRAGGGQRRAVPEADCSGRRCT